MYLTFIDVVRAIHDDSREFIERDDRRGETRGVHGRERDARRDEGEGGPDAGLSDVSPSVESLAARADPPLRRRPDTDRPPGTLLRPTFFSPFPRWPM